MSCIVAPDDSMGCVLGNPLLTLFSQASVDKRDEETCFFFFGKASVMILGVCCLFM